MRTLALLALAGAWLLGGCGSPTSNQSQQGTQPVIQLAEATETAHLQFTFAMLQQLDKGENLCFSPLSLEVALGMTLNGAAGETFDAIAQTLGYKELRLSEFNSQMRQLTSLLKPTDTDVHIHLANSLWVHRGFELKPDFLRTLLTVYDSRVETVDFSNPKATADTINQWVREQTNQLIYQLFEPSDFRPETRLALVNTLYFEGKWQHPFDKSATVEAPFYLENGTEKQVPMMHLGKQRLPYLRSEGFEAVALPYGKGDYQFYLFVPLEEHSVGELRKQFTPENWRKWRRAFKLTEGTVAMPRFKLEALHNLQPPLEALGMGIAFTPSKADFSSLANVAPGELFLDKAVQKAVVEVGEEGTKAAAATGLTFTLTAAEPNAFQIVANRPFLFAITHQPTGVVLFVGIVREP